MEFIKTDTRNDFNPRPREEGDSWHIYLSFLTFYFNPRPREEGDIIVLCLCRLWGNFNPRPREEGD